MKLWFYKRQLRHRYLRYCGILDEFSCGAALAEHLSSRIRDAKEKVNETIRRLKQIDPTCTLSELQ